MSEYEEGEARSSAKKPMTFFRAYVTMMGIVAVLLISVLVAAWAYARHLPREIKDVRALVVPQPPHIVWAKLRQVEQFPQWRKGLQAVQVVARDSDGITQWTELRPADQTSVRVIGEAIPDSLDLEFTTAQGITQTRWTLLLEPVPPDSTLLTIHSSVTMRTPLYRIAARWFEKPSVPVEQFLQQLVNACSASSQGKAPPSGQMPAHPQ